jgi:hypothetical protein
MTGGQVPGLYYKRGFHYFEWSVDSKIDSRHISAHKSARIRAHGFGSYKLNPLARLIAVGYIVSVEFNAYREIDGRLLGLLGLGIINMALEGPTRDIRRIKIGMATANMIFRHLLMTDDLKIDRKSSEQRYDSCVACMAPESAPRGTNLLTDSVRTRQSKALVMEACMSSSWNLATNCNVVEVFSERAKPTRCSVHCSTRSKMAPPRGIRCGKV